MFSLRNSIFVFFYLLLAFFINNSSGFVGFAVDGLGRGYLARTNDSGASWLTVLQGPVNLSSIAFPSLNSLIAVGYNGSIIGSSPASINGSIWSDPITTSFSFRTVIPPTREQFRTVLFINSNLGLTAGTRGVIYRTTDSGNTWNSVKPPLLFRVVNCLFAGNSTIWAVGNAGLILKSIDYGLNWIDSNKYNISNMNYYQNFYSASSLDDYKFIIVGYGGTILKTSDGGNSFNYNYIGIGFDTSLSFNSVHYYDNNIIYISGEKGLLIRSLDGGLTYKPLNISLSLPTARLHSLTFLPLNLSLPSTLGVGDSVIAVAAIRDRVLLTRFTDGASWVESPPTKLNYIERLAILPAPVCFPTPNNFIIAAVSGLDIPFNISIQNTGTTDLFINSIVVSSSLLKISSNTPLTLVARPMDPPTRFFFIFAAAGLSRGVYHATIQFRHNSPSTQTSIQVKVVVVQSPSISDPSFIQQYWWVLALSVITLFAVSIYLVRRRLRKIRAYNRRVLDPELHLLFWRFWCCANTREHDSDSDFWIEQGGDEGGFDENGDPSDDDGWDIDHLNDDSDDSNADSGEYRSKKNKKNKKQKKKKKIVDSDSDSISDQDYSEKDVMKQILKNRFDVSDSNKSQDEESSVSKSNNSRKGVRRLSMKPQTSSAGNASGGIGGGPRKSIFVASGGLGLQSGKGLHSSKKSK